MGTAQILTFPDQDAADATHTIGFHFHETTFNFSDVDGGGQGIETYGEPTWNVFITAPAIISEANGFQYSTANYGMLGDIMSMGGAGDNLASLFSGGDIVDAKNVPSSSTPNFVGNLLQRSAGNSVMSNMMSAMSRTTPNVREEQLFAQPDFRQFTFNFDLFPRTENESIILNKIIKVFRSCSYPSMTEDNLRFIFPDEVAIRYYLQNNQMNEDRLPIIGKSVVTSLSVNYGGAGIVKLFQDGSPANVNLTLTIKECKLNNRKSDVIPDMSYG